MKRPRAPSGRAAFLLAQVGAHAAQRFGERVQALGLTPADAGVLRLVAAAPGRSQQDLAEQLGLSPSRVVALIDELEGKGLLERRRNPDDRRTYALALTAEGTDRLAQVSRLAAEHEADLCAALDDGERAILAGLLRRIAEQQGLKPGIHPGYRNLGS
ncbi:MAG TPA: MarR family transcriptional regulator [Thermoanaerobaculia bacterium]|nr:MarR family transcriptional regulator [Thermoanaerobaculia bacterium]